MDTKKLIGAIIGIIAFGALIAGATFAFWQWSTNTSERTNVSFNVVNSVNDLMGANLDGGASVTVSNLAPASCTNTMYAMKKEITLSYYNQTSQNANINATLTLSSPHQEHSGTLRLNNLHYALTTGENASDSCTSGTVLAGGATSSFPAFTNGTKIINNLTIKTVSANTGSKSSPLNETYYLWVWIDANDTGSNTGSTVTDPMQELSFTLTWTGDMIAS